MNRLKAYICDLTKRGNYLSKHVIPSLTTGNMGYAVSQFMNSEQNTWSLHFVPTLRALTSPSKRPRLSPRSISSDNLPFPSVVKKYSPDEAMKKMTKDSTQTTST